MVLLTVRTHGQIVQIVAIYRARAPGPLSSTAVHATHRRRTCRPTGKRPIHRQWQGRPGVKCGLRTLPKPARRGKMRTGSANLVRTLPLCRSARLQVRSPHFTPGRRTPFNCTAEYSIFQLNRNRKAKLTNVRCF